MRNHFQECIATRRRRKNDFVVAIAVGKRERSAPSVCRTRIHRGKRRHFTTAGFSNAVTHYIHPRAPPQKPAFLQVLPARETQYAMSLRARKVWKQMSPAETAEIYRYLLSLSAKQACAGQHAHAFGACMSHTPDHPGGHLDCDYKALHAEDASPRATEFGRNEVPLTVHATNGIRWLTMVSSHRVAGVMPGTHECCT